ncbi:hypothetical protein WDZ92_08670 [Nostoc sp. NIES-2111]
MAAKVTPLDAFEFGKFTFENDGKLWACLKGNKGEGAYNFKGDDFVLKSNVFTGLVDDGNYWLVTNLASGSIGSGQTFDIAIREQKDGKWTVNKEESEKQAIQWQKDGCNAVILCNEIPVLKTLVKVLDDLKVILKPGSGEITVRYNITDEQTPAIENALALFITKALSGELPKPNTPEYDAAAVVANAGLMALPVLSQEQLPQKVLYDLFNNPVEKVVECFPFEGEVCPYTKLLVTPPKPSEKKGSGRGGYGGANVTTTVTAYLSPSEREKYICESLRSMGMTIEGDNIASIQKAMLTASSGGQTAAFTSALKLAYQMTTDNWIMG